MDDSPSITPKKEEYNSILEYALNKVGLGHRYTDRVDKTQNRIYVSHYIVKVQKAKFLWFVPYKKKIEVAKITSESPQAHALYETGLSLKRDGLKILIKEDCPKDIEGKIRLAAKTLEQGLEEKVEVYKESDEVFAGQF